MRSCRGLGSGVGTGATEPERVFRLARQRWLVRGPVAQILIAESTPSLPYEPQRTPVRNHSRRLASLVREQCRSITIGVKSQRP